MIRAFHARFTEVVRMKVAFFSFGACEGCRYRIVNEFAKIATLLEKYGIEIVREPLLGVKTEKNYDVAIIEGAVTSLDIERVKEIRRKAKFLIALGSCAFLGGIATLGYKYGVQADEYLKKGYSLGVPLHQIVKVDGYVRGCPASVDELVNVLEEIAVTGSISKYERRFEYEKQTDLVLDDGFLRLDTGKCIVCGRCIELCSKIYANVLTQAFRGYRVIVTTPAQISFLEAGCIRCGLCAAYCPVAAITYRNDVEAALKTAKNGGRVVIERQAVEAIAKALGIKPGQVIPLLKTLGFSKVEIVNPLSLIDAEKTGIVPYSSAEKRLVEQVFPEASKYLLEYPKLSLDKDTVLVTVCVARKEDHSPVLTVHELVSLARDMLITFKDLPEEQPESKNNDCNVKIAKGPEEVKAAIQDFLSNPRGIAVLQICPGGCAKGSGLHFPILNDY